LRRDFDEVAGPTFCILVVNLAEAAIITQGLPDTPEICKIQQLMREALHQIDRQNPAPSDSRNSRSPARQQDNQEANQHPCPHNQPRPRYQGESHHAESSRGRNRDRGNYHDAREIINGWCHGRMADETDRFPAFSQNINYAEYPIGFNPVNMQNLKKYDSK